MSKELSLKGIARQYRELGDSLSVRHDLLDADVAGTISLRAHLEALARKEWSYSTKGTGCGWVRAKYEQVWTHIRVRIELKPKGDVTEADLNALRPVWKSGIEDGWGNDQSWGCARSGELACKLSIEVIWVSSNRHFKIKVHEGATRSNSRNWDTEDDAWTVAHEFGHLLGHPDEYAESACNLVGTGTIMDLRDSYLIPERLVQRFATNIGSIIVTV